MFTKTHFSVLIAAALLGLSVVACHFDLFDEWGANLEKAASPTEATASTEATPMATPSVRGIAGDITSERAMQLLYGNYDATMRRALWQPTSEELEAFGYNATVKTAYTNVLLAAPFSEDSTDKYLVLTRTLPQAGTCRGCVPVLGGAIYQRDDTVSDVFWLPLNESKFIARMASADQWSGRIVRLGNGSNGAILHWRYTNAGFTEEGDMLVSMRDNQLHTLLAVVTGGNNAAECDDADATKPPCWKYASRLKFESGTNAAYDDLLITQQGTRLSEDGGEMVTVNHTQRYVYLKGSYVPQRQAERPVRPRP